MFVERTSGSRTCEKRLDKVVVVVDDDDDEEWLRLVEERESGPEGDQYPTNLRTIYIYTSTYVGLPILCQ